MKYFYFTLFVFISLPLFAQTTAIPDEYFEGALISSGIDTDGQLNGMVLTADIANLTELHISDKGIEDLTGIEDFTALEVLELEDNNLYTLDVSNNLFLRELYAGNPSELPQNSFTSIDLSNNDLLEVVRLENIPELESINLKNDNNSILTNVNVTCYIEGASCNTDLCIEIDNEQAANNNQSPYSSWMFDSSTTLSENCNLATEDKNLQGISFYPNPTSDVLFIESHNEIENLQLFNLNGKLLKSWKGKKIEKISLNNLSGVYFIKVYSNKNSFIKKIIKL